MNRSSIVDALVINIKPLGENNSTVTLLTSQNQIVYATLYGGPKSRLKSLVSLYNSGKIWLYENPEKNQIKISDFEVHNYHSSFTQNLFKIYAANLVCELSIKTKCAGANEEFYKYLCGFLDGMDLCNEEQSRLGLIRFLWRFLILMGVQPITNECEQCGNSFLDSKFDISDFSYYNRIDNCFICKNCFNATYGYQGNNQSNFYIPIKISTIRYLEAISTLPPAEVRKLKISKDEYEDLKQIIFFLVEKNVGQKLNSIETGMGIL